MEISNNGLTLMNGYGSVYPTHPGSVLGEELKARGIRQKDFAAQIGMQATHLSAIINCARNVTPAIAQKITIGLTDVPAEFWLNLQQKYNADIQRLRLNPSLLVSGYSIQQNNLQPALAQPEPTYGSQKTLNITLPVKDMPVLDAISKRLGWEIEE